MGGLQQTATVLRASPDGRSVVGVPASSLTGLRGLICVGFFLPVPRGRSATCTSVFPAPGTHLLLPEGQPAGIRVPPTYTALLEPVPTGEDMVTYHVKTLLLFNAKPVAFC